MGKKNEPITKLYRLFRNGQAYKTYDKINRLKAAIHLHRRENLMVEIYEVRPPCVVDAATIMGGPRCPECGEYPHKDKNYSHEYGCSLDPRNQGRS